MVNHELEIMWVKKQACLGIILEELRKASKISGQLVYWPRFESVSPEYKSVGLSNESACSAEM
jgi:hypothetical protein